MHNHSRLGKVIKSSRIKMGILLQPYTFVSSVQVKQGENSQWVQKKPGQSWVFLSAALCLSGSIQPCLKACSKWSKAFPTLCSIAQSKKAHLTLFSHHTLMWCDRPVPPLLSVQPTTNSYTRPFPGLLPRTEFCIFIFNQPVSGLKTFGVDRTS